jgi:uroporphyrinogen decarboxylase
MTPRERFMMALDGKQPSGRIPHFELVFFLTMEAMGRVHPCHRRFDQWDQMSDPERQLQRRDIADVYVQIARKYEHSAIFLHGAGGWHSDPHGEHLRTLEEIRDISGMDYFTMMHGDATHGIPSAAGMMKFVEDIAENRQKVRDDAEREVDKALATAKQYAGKGLLDCWALCSDYCFNTGPFISPEMFEEFITPNLARLTAGYREMGFYVIKHTDGNIMPILDALLSTKPHALHSLDPQGGVDIAKVRKIAGDKCCLIGNVNCAMLDTGTDEQVIESARYALKHGPGPGGYIFSTSNCIYTGMELRRYELMLDVWRKEGNV